jgi:formylmethanofuran dehydrogenase subunit E
MTPFLTIPVESMRRIVFPKTRFRICTFCAKCRKLISNSYFVLGHKGHFCKSCYKEMTHES